MVWRSSSKRASRAWNAKIGKAISLRIAEIYLYFAYEETPCCKVRGCLIPAGAVGVTPIPVAQEVVTPEGQHCFSGP